VINKRSKPTGIQELVSGVLTFVNPCHILIRLPSQTRVRITLDNIRAGVVSLQHDTESDILAELISEAQQLASSVLDSETSLNR
jgi:hypothetical protein